VVAALRVALGCPPVGHAKLQRAGSASGIAYGAARGTGLASVNGARATIDAASTGAAGDIDAACTDCTGSAAGGLECAFSCPRGLTLGRSRSIAAQGAGHADAGAFTGARVAAGPRGGHYAERGATAGAGLARAGLW
jgi:hypothetical protein